MGTNGYPSSMLPGNFQIGQVDPSMFPDMAALFQRQQADALGRKKAETYYGPQQVMTEQAREINATRLGLLNFDTEYQQMALKRDAALQGRKQELERGLANGQLGNIEKLRALAKEQLANQQTDLSQQRVKVKDMAKRSQWDLRSDLTKRGAFNTVANERGTGRINRDEAYSIQSLNNQGTQANISYMQGQVGYDNQALQLQNRLAGLGLDGEATAHALENGSHVGEVG